MQSTSAVRNDLTFAIRRNIQLAVSNSCDALNFRKFNPADFKIEAVSIPIPNLPAPFHNYRIVHISDIHYGQWISKDRLNGVVDLINDAQPDLVAITGDFVSYLWNESIEQMAVALSRLKPKDRTLAVLGNHDHWLGADKVRRVLKESGILDVSNDLCTVSRGNYKLVIAGVDSVMAEKDRLDAVLEKTPLDTPAVILVHEPDFALKSAATRRFSLQLSGHSHGGQFVIPGLGTPFKAGLSSRFPLGRYDVDGMIQYTNRGLGTNGYWIRVNCPPEITMISLV